MKKTRVLIIFMSAFLVSITSMSCAGQSSSESISSGSDSDMSEDDQVFITKLDDENAQLFSQMSSQKRKEAMNMTEMMDATGVLLSPNEAVFKVASTIGKSK